MKNRFISLSFGIGFIINVFSLYGALLKATPSWNWQKNKQKLSNNLILNFGYLKIICFLHPHYHPEILGDIIKNVQKISTSA